MSKQEFKSTYERLISEDPDFKKDLEVRYKKLLLSELIVTIMQEDQTSVRRISKSLFTLQ